MPKLSPVQAILLVSCVLPLLVSAQELTNYTFDFLAVYLSVFDNLRQTQTGASDNQRVTVKQISVDVPALRPAAVVIYTELVIEGEVQNMLLGAVYERPGPTIEIKIYNFTDSTLFKPGEFNVSTLYDLPKEQLTGGDCTATYKRLARAVYVGTFPDCANIIEGNNPNTADTFVCIRASLIFPPTLLGYSKTPYILDRTGGRFPTIGFPDTYDRICGRSGQVTRRYK